MTALRLLPRITLVLLLALVATGQSCDDPTAIVPDDCVQSEPGTGPLTVRVTINATYPEVEVTVYRGNFEKNDVVATAVLDQTEHTFDVQVDVLHTVVAAYTLDARTCLTLDQGEVSTEFEDFGDTRCWSVNPSTANVPFSDSCPGAPAID